MYNLFCSCFSYVLIQENEIIVDWYRGIKNIVSP